MIEWRVGRVERELARWAGAVEYAVVPLPTGTGQQSSGPVDRIRALAYVDTVGELRPGERVALNTAALSRGLGTGGVALVVAPLDRVPTAPIAGPGHIVKARYTALQQMVLALEEQESPHHDVLATADDLAGLPVVVADLHSAVPAVVAGVRTEAPGTRVVYVMTDGGALPAAFSRTLSGLRASGWLSACVTVGQAYGGDAEAVSVHSGLLAAKEVLEADLVVVAQGPGNVGTGTTWGFSGVAAGEALNATTVLGGHGVASLRISQGDARGRHRGVSHHSRTAYGRVVLGRADLVVPRLGGEIGALVSRQAADLVRDALGDLRRVDVPVDGLLETLRACPVPLSTMGRDLEQDAAAFLSGAAAGRWAVRQLVR